MVTMPAAIMNPAVPKFIDVTSWIHMAAPKRGRNARLRFFCVVNVLCLFGYVQCGRFVEYEFAPSILKCVKDGESDGSAIHETMAKLSG